MKNLLDLTWKVAVTRGVLGVIFGLILLIWPTTALVFVLLWGIFVLLDGIGWITSAFARGQSGSRRAMSALLGVLALVVAFFAIFRPGVAAATLVIFLGIWLIVRGIGSALVGIVAAKGRTRWLVLLGAALDILLGVLFFLNPLGTATVIVVIIGIAMIAWGGVFVVLGLVLRKGARELPEGPITIEGSVV